jgi:hypothetical protein
MTSPRKPDTKPAQDMEDKNRGPEQPSDDEVDEVVEDTFPASDPPAWSSVTGAGEPDEHNGNKPG